MTIALLSNVTVESLALRLEKEVEKAEKVEKKERKIQVFTPPGFDTWRTELLNPSSQLWGDDVTTIYVILHGPELFLDGVDASFAQVLAEPLDILSRTQIEHKDKILVVSTLDLPSSPARPLTARNFSTQASAYWQSELEKRDIPILDLAELVVETGRERFYSPKIWYFGSLPFSRQGELLLAQEIMRVEKILRGARKKCLVLDLDNTLWGGVVSEDGIEGISLASFGMGAPYRDVQRVAKALSQQGILLAIASKNNREDALRPLREHPHMLLREEDFVKIKADWNPKPSNIEAIAQELGIGLDSLVFIDDNPVEREAVKLALPEVAVPDFPDGNTPQLPAFMKQVAQTYFTALRLGEEDLRKTEMYRVEAKREAAREAHLSLDDYLASLEMKLNFYRLGPDAEEIPRAAQLTQKTNQFNVTARRYTEAEVAAMTHDGRFRVWMAELRDRFGDYGRICLVIARLNVPEADEATIDTFLMSCRVMGRQVEDAVLGCVERSLAEEGVTTLRGEYRKTNKNEPIRDFWDKMGYRLEADASEGSIWILRAPFNGRRSKICLNC